MHWYAHYIADYALKTRHLTLIEHGAYRLLLDYYYSNGGPFKDDRKAIYRVCNAIERSERRAIDRVLDLFFTISEPFGDRLATVWRPFGDRVWSHSRAEIEISKSRNISDIRKKAGANAHANAKRKNMQLHTQSQPQSQSQSFYINKKGNDNDGRKTATEYADEVAREYRASKDEMDK